MSVELNQQIALLSKVPFFENLDELALRDLAERVTVTTFTTGQTIMQEGEVGQRVFVLSEGYVGVYRTGLDGNENVVAYLSPPEVVGELALLDESPRSASVKALERTEAIVLEKQDFLDFVEANPRAAFGIFRTLTKRIRETLDVINAMASQSADEVDTGGLAKAVSGSGSDRVAEAERTRSEEEALGLYLVKEEILDRANMIMAMNRAMDAGAPLSQVLIRMKLVEPGTLSAAEGRLKRLGRARAGEVRPIIERIWGAGLIDEEKLNDLKAKTSDEVVDILKEEYALTDEDVINIIEHGATCFRIIPVDELDSDTISSIPSELISEHRVVPLSIEDGLLRLGMVAPEDTFVQNMVAAATGFKVEPWLLTSRNYNELKVMIDQVVGLEGTGSRAGLHVLKELSGLLRGTAEKKGGNRTIPMLEGILRTAIISGASDIHIEPMDKKTRIRFRIDGILQDIVSIPQELHPRLVGALKAAADMDVANRLVPHDGKAMYSYDDDRYMLRLSTLPTVRGEKVVIRIHKDSDVTLGIRDLGPTEKQFKIMTKLSKSPYGMLLVTGPVGSGKTTTLYSILHSVDVLRTNVVTIEDPIEYELPGINHIQVNPKSGLTYTVGLKAILRQDPDVIMLGEIRDAETAGVATRAACTGVLMLTTLHTNDAPSAVTALLHLGVEPFFIVNSLLGVIAQRLVRVVCNDCAETYVPDIDVLKSLGLDPSQEYHFRRGTGCSACGHSGYKGRIGIFEIMPVRQKMRDLILSEAPESELRRQAMSEGMITLRQAAVVKVVEGLTTPEELLRKTAEEEVTSDDPVSE